MTTPAAALPELTLAAAGEWRKWLATHHAESPGVRLVLARKGASAPTSLTYQEALLDALAYGWIDGQGNRRDDATYLVRFTPRRKRSIWSKRNTVIAEPRSRCPPTSPLPSRPNLPRGRCSPL